MNCIKNVPVRDGGNGGNEILGKVVIDLIKLHFFLVESTFIRKYLCLLNIIRIWRALEGLWI